MVLSESELHTSENIIFCWLDRKLLKFGLGKMTASSCLVYLSGSILCSSCRPLTIHQSSKCRFQFIKVSRRKIQHSSSFHTHIKYASSGRSGHQRLPSDSGSDHEPFFLSMIKDVAWSLKSLSIFLAEQPSQLKYIEWPTFQNTLKTATLTLVLVALLIVALSTVDSSLCYVLALLLRKTA